MMMKAIGLKSRGGGVEMLAELELPLPELKPKDILIKMEAVGMNPVDAKWRSMTGELQNPLVLGYDGVGTVAKIGSDSTLFKVGQKVWLSGDITRNGTNAEYVAADERLVGRAPQSISSAQAAAVPLVMITAWEGIFEELDLKAFDPKNDGKTILVLPGAGGVGSFVIQLAKKLCGLTVVATASRPESEAAAKGLGADYVVNHRKPLKEQLDKLGLSGVDYIYNCYDPTVYFDQYCEIINPLGKIVTIVETNESMPIHKLKLKRVSFLWEFMFARSMFGVDLVQQHHILNNAAGLIDSGLIKLPDVQVHPYSLENVKKLHQNQESQQMIGKAVLQM